MHEQMMLRHTAGEARRNGLCQDVQVRRNACAGRRRRGGGCFWTVCLFSLGPFTADLRRARRKKRRRRSRSGRAASSARCLRGGSRKGQLADLSGSGLTEKALCPESERITAESFAAWKAAKAWSAAGLGNCFGLGGSRDVCFGRLAPHELVNKHLEPLSAFCRRANLGLVDLLSTNVLDEVVYDSPPLEKLGHGGRARASEGGCVSFYSLRQKTRQKTPDSSLRRGFSPPGEVRCGDGGVRGAEARRGEVKDGTPPLLQCLWGATIFFVRPCEETSILVGKLLSFRPEQVRQVDFHAGPRRRGTCGALAF